MYWRPEHVRREQDRGMSARDWRDAVLESLRVAVRRRMVADVPVGVLLSGGLDSSLVVALLADEGQVGLKTFSVGFHAAAGESGDEFEYSDIIAKHFGTDHQQILVDPTGCPRRRRRHHRDERADGQPRLRGLHLLSEEVAKSVKVVQSGQGADEVFASYSWYPPLAEWPLRRVRVRARVHRPPTTPGGHPRTRVAARRGPELCSSPSTSPVTGPPTP